MNDSVSILVALVLLVLVIRWLFGSSTEQGSGLPHRPVPEEWVRTVHTMFPHLPPVAIRRELERTRSVELTCERILRDGTLPMLPSDMASVSSSTGATSEGSHANRNQPQGVSTSLLQRYQLTDEQVKNLSDDTSVDRTWETDGTEREKRLQARKLQMVLMARKRMLAQDDTSSDHPADNGKGKERADFD